MASYKYTFTSGATVTPARLNDARDVFDIVNADIKSDAAIAGTKIAPNFGSQNATTTGVFQSNGTGSSFASINGGTADGASLQLNRGGSASQNAYVAQFQGSLLLKNLDSGSIVFTNTTSDTERMRIDSNGNVGIGTNNPACLLDCSQTNAGSGTEIRAGNSDTGASSSASVRCIQGSVNATITCVSNAASYFGNVSNHPMVVFTNNLERMRVTADGNVGIGESNLSAKLTVKGGGTNDTTPEVRIAGTSGSIDFYNALPSGSYNSLVADNDKAIIFTEGSIDTGNLVIGPHATGAKGIKILANGRVGIGTSSPTQELSVVGDITATAGISAGTSLYAQNYVYIGGVQVIEARKTGWAAATGTATRTTFATSTVTTAQLAERVKALIDDLRSHGLIGN